MKVEWFKVGPSEDLDEGADGVGNICKDSVGLAMFTVVNSHFVVFKRQ